MKKNNKKLKENPVMVNQKNIKGVKINDDAGDQNEIKAFFIIIIVIAILIGAIYGLTELLKNEKKLSNDEIVEVAINYDVASVGMILNRPYDEYYVLAYDSDDNKAVLYSTLLSQYMQKADSDNYIKIYYTDLGSELNNKYYNVNNDDKSNPNAKSIEEFDFGNVTLLKVNKGKIIKYIEDFNSIKEILK